MARRLPHRSLAAALLIGASLAAVSFLSIPTAGVAGRPPNVGPLEATATPPPAVDATALFAEARSAQDEGEYETAAARYRRIVDAASDSPQAPEALLQLGAISSLEGEYREAESAFAKLLERYPGGPEARLATFWQAETLAALGRSPEAVSLYEQFAASTPELAGQARLQRARLLLAHGDAAAALSDARAAVIPTTTKEVYRSARRTEADALAAMGDTAGALKIIGEELDAAEGSGTRAELLSALASIQRDSGDTAAWRATLAELVRDHPRTGAAARALDTLLARFPGAVRPYLEGRVRFYQRRNEDALDAFRRLEAATPASAELPWAAYFTAIIRERQGRDTDALGVLDAALSNHPGSPALEEVLWERSWLLGALARHVQAAESYRTYRSRYPSSDRAEDARFAQGLHLYLSGDLRRAAAAWAEEPDGTRHPLRGRSGLWRAKALQRLGDPQGAAAALSEAQSARPGRYYAQRASALAGSVAAQAVPLASPAITEEERAAADRWLSTWAQDSALGTAATPVELDPHVRRGDLLVRLGKREAALWEYRAAIATAGAHPVRLYALARYLHDRGEHWVSIQAAAGLWELAPVRSPDELPPGVLKLLYPAPYWGLVLKAARAQDIDPLLLVALMRQESRFTPWVGSGAGALGLTQVMPATGEEIARSLGRSGFERSDLFRPNVSIEFGAYYLARQLAALGGRPEFALAAYNGGAGNALRWMNRDRTIDPDLFVESIDFDETALYVRTVMEDYGIYRNLYAGGG